MKRGPTWVIQSTYMNSWPVNSSRMEMAVRFMAPPSGVPMPPKLQPQPMERRMGTAGLQPWISS